MVFPAGGEVARHPSQLYEAGLEGIVLGLLLWFLFWKTDARYQPGKLVGTFILGYGISRFLVELVRQPDAGLENLSWGLTMGQPLTVPMILARKSVVRGKRVSLSEDFSGRGRIKKENIQQP